MRHPQREPFTNGVHAASGYSLTELAIVLAIIGLVAGTTLSVGKVQMDIAEFQSTKERLETVRDALRLFQKKYERYPCPALPGDSPTSGTYGQEAAGCAITCPVGLTCGTYAVIGAVPFKTLRINEELAYDSWGGKITYAMEKLHAAGSNYNQGNIPVFDVNGNEITRSPGMGKVIFVLVSHGENGKGAYTKAGTQEACATVGKDIENCIDDDIFVDSRFNLGEIAANYYDDLLLWQPQENVPLLLENRHTTLAARAQHACAIKNDGTVWCWGLNDHGQLGDNTAINRNVPVQAIGVTDAIEVATQTYDSCALKSDGTVWCWGWSFGTPPGPESITDVLQLSGRDGTRMYALKSDDTIWWSDGGPWTQDTDSPTSIVQADAGYDHTCVVKSDGTVWCWGRNRYGQLADGTSTDSYTVPVQASGLRNAFRVSAADDNTCALKSDGTLWCWGQPTSDGGGQKNSLTRMTMVKTSCLHACALKSTGTVWCWGENQYGQLGNNSTVAVGSGQPPVRANITDVAEIAVGSVVGNEGFTCAKKTDGTLWCWGRGTSGQLGNGAFSDSAVPVQVQNFP